MNRCRSSYRPAGFFGSKQRRPCPEKPVAIHPLPADTSYAIALRQMQYAPAGVRQKQHDTNPGRPSRRGRADRAAPSSRAERGDTGRQAPARPISLATPCSRGSTSCTGRQKPFRLEPGEHVLTIKAGGSDTNYFLPIAWLTGDFAVDNGTIRAVPKSIDAGALWKHGLADFTGLVTYTTQVKIPDHSGDVKLRLNTGGLYTAVTLDGKSLGERAWAPFEWQVPAGMKGKEAELQISVWTSVAPIFGDWKNPAGAWKKKFWVPPPSPRPEVGLLSGPEWLLY